MFCPYCSPNTAGQHEYNCPFYEKFNQIDTTFNGWICSKCGKVNSPFISSCDCWITNKIIYSGDSEIKL